LRGGDYRNTNINMKYQKVNGIYLQIPEIVRPAGFVGVYLNDAKTGKLKSFDYIKNTYVTTGKNSLSAHQRGVANKGEITYCAVGTDDTAPIESDTKLLTEIERKLISTREENAGAENANDYTIFFNTSEANGSLREAGLFGDDASDTVDTGTLFTRVAINREKSTSDTLTIAWTVIIG